MTNIDAFRKALRHHPSLLKLLEETIAHNGHLYSGTRAREWNGSDGIHEFVYGCIAWTGENAHRWMHVHAEGLPPPEGDIWIDAFGVTHKKENVA